jgi:hypothetical protein
VSKNLNVHLLRQSGVLQCVYTDTSIRARLWRWCDRLAHRIRYRMALRKFNRRFPCDLDKPF